ncbi:MAG: triose-phosphate isomerase [Myxococcales bacterium]|nr:triose-phosphate isomerase [Myxococcales bacterium]
MGERRAFVAGNWKMNGDRAASKALLEALAAAVGAQTEVDVAVAPPYTALESAAAALDGTTIALAAQNMHHAASGAYTGEISAGMLLEVGVTAVILGHSERRQYFGETDAGVRSKAEAAVAAGLAPIVCVGETLEQREAGGTLDVVRGQVEGALKGWDAAQMATVTIAYEPVWAIGTGKTATPAQAQEVHAALRALLAELFGDEVAGATRILYGGSVKPHNAAELFGQEDIDGGLVGGASLKADAFAAIIEAAR